MLVLGESVLLLILVFLLKESAPALSHRHWADFLWRKEWIPLAPVPQFGIAHAWVSTLIVTVIALVLAVPLGIGIGLFTSEVAPPPMRMVLRPSVELLAGIPSVVYGFFGTITLVRGFEHWFSMAAGECLLVAGIVLGIMSLPFVAATCAESLRVLPAELRAASASLGVTRWHGIRRILIPAALPGFFAAATLGSARAIGETMAVLMLVGNSVGMPQHLLDRGQPLTALIATDLGGAARGSEHYLSIFAAALVLFTITVVLHLAIGWLKRRLIRHG
jgi:phosphate ABC transporter permease protein PstC